MDPKLTLKTSLQYIKGVGPERFKVLARLNLATLDDLYHFFPRRYENRSPVKRVSEMSGEDKECVAGIIQSRGLIRTKTRQLIFKVVVSDGERSFFALWFNQAYLQKVFAPKMKVLLYGKAEKTGKIFQMVHPEYEIQTLENSPLIHMGRNVPIYSLTEDLSQKFLRQFVYRALEKAQILIQEPYDAVFRKKLSLIERIQAFRQIHFPDSDKNLEKAYRRLVFDEFFAMQIFLEMKKAEFRKENKLLKHDQGKEEVSRFIESLDFELTAGQKTALASILKDMESGRPMSRLVQGDVGSGKTVVAAAALIFTASNGFQGVLMAPTEVLAQQHYLNLCQFLEPLGISCGYLAQSMPEEERQRTLRGLASGEVQIVVGTHALIQEEVRFRKLGLAVIDEQHKFGVFQRAALRSKAEHTPHFLLMTATPIPRTLALTLYGDLDVSLIQERPQGRKDIQTFWVGENKRPEIYGLLESVLSKGQQGYVICPLIEEKDLGSAKSVQKAHKELSEIFSHRRVGILHGKMKSDEKKRVMNDFKEKKTDLLVSTVVIEVGVNVPNANFMIIENAEKFGLAQLHQLRGRIGRGSEESVCVLFAASANQETQDRLNAFQDTQSGFEIAEKDLALRGGGDIVGDRQHGLPALRIGDLIKDFAVLALAKKTAQEILHSDPKLLLPKNRGIRKMAQERFGVKKERQTVSA